MAPLLSRMAAARLQLRWRLVLAQDVLVPSLLRPKRNRNYCCHRTAPFTTSSRAPLTSHSKRRRLQRFSGHNWVPVAYQGRKPTNGVGSQQSPTTGGSAKPAADPTNAVQSTIPKVKQHPVNQLSASEKEDLRAKRNRLHFLFVDFLKRVSAYQTSLHKDERADIQTRIENAEKHLLLSKNNFLVNRVQETLRGLQDFDAPVDEAKLLATEKSFIEVCKTMQHMCSTSCYLSNRAIDDATFSIFVGIAEKVLVEMLRFQQERSLLIESAQLWGKQAKRNALQTQGKEVHHKTGVSKWLNNVVKSIFSPTRKGDQDDKQQQENQTPGTPEKLIGDTAPMSQTIKSLDETTQRLLSKVINSIVSYTTRQLNDTTDDLGPEVSVQHRRILNIAAERVLNVLETVPTSWGAVNDGLNKAVQFLIKAATYQSAQKCRMVFERHYSPNNSDPRLSSVLQAYLTAIKHSGTPKTEQQEIVKEAYDFLDGNWDHSVSSVGNERLQAVSVMLQIVAFYHSVKSEDKTDSDRQQMSEMADSLLKKATGNDSATELLQKVSTKSTGTSNEIIPLLDPLALLYALSEDSERVEPARKILDFLKKGKFARLPTTKMCNAVLFNVVHKHEQNEEWKNTDHVKDMEYANELLEFMYQRTDPNCMPDDHTLTLVFRLLKAIGPDDEGFRAQHILSLAESYYLLVNTGTPKSMGLSIYHEVLRAWLRVASSKGHQNNDISAAEQSLWLVERMEIRSKPSFLSDQMLLDSAFPYLYDIKARPTETTYQLVLEACSATVNETHFQKAANVALTVAKKFEPLDFPEFKLDIERHLRDCAKKLDQQSELAKEIELFYSKDQESESTEKTDM